MRTKTIDLNKADELHRALCLLVREWSRYPYPEEINALKAADQLANVVEPFEIQRGW